MRSCRANLAAGEVLHHYVVVRPDLPLGLLAAQVTHAAGESSTGDIPEGTHAVVLSATVDDMRALIARLTAAAIPHVVVVENDPPYEDQLMAVGIRPLPRAQVRKYVSAFPLLREKGGAKT